MAPENLSNDSTVSRFSLQEYVDKIKLESYVLEHMEETSREFHEYMKLLLQFDDYALVTFWVSLFFEELVSSYQMEHAHLINFDLIDKNKLFFDSLTINHSSIQRLHDFVLKHTDNEVNKDMQYRVTNVRVSKMTRKGEFIFWRGVEAKDVKFFMDQFVQLYKSKNVSTIFTNPFLKSALVHLLFVRIHPFTEGNGRTARLIHGMCFTNRINEIYDMKLKISPFNISPNILVNQLTYANRLNSIYFDLEHDSNEEINRWFDFILNMADEQLFYLMSKKDRLMVALNNIEHLSADVQDEIKDMLPKMKIRK